VDMKDERHTYWPLIKAFFPCPDASHLELLLLHPPEQVRALAPRGFPVSLYILPVLIMFRLKFCDAVLGAVNTQEVMCVNVGFGILVHFFLTVFEHDSHCGHLGNSLGYCLCTVDVYYQALAMADQRHGAVVVSSDALVSSDAMPPHPACAGRDVLGSPETPLRAHEAATPKCEVKRH
jgi:hypothetical protein